MWGRAGPPRPRAGAVRGGRGCARPVLLPPSGRVPRPPGRGGDPRSVQRAAPRRAPAVRRARGAAGGRRRRVPRARTGGSSRRRWCRRATCASGRTGRSCRAGRRSSRPRRCRCGRRAATAWRSSTPARASCSAPSTRRGRTPRCTTARCTCTAGASFEVDGLDLEGRRALVHPFDGDWYTQPKYETDTYIERLIERRSALGVTLSFGTVVVTEQVLAYQKRSLSDHEAIDLIGARPPADVVRHAGAVVRARRRDPRRAAAAGGAARLAARRRALADRGAAAAGDVRPLGHRRPVHQPPSADRPPDDLHLRRAPRRDRDRPPGVRGVRGARRRRAPARQRVPVRERLPVVRAVAQVRQPERAAVEGRLRRADGPDARRRLLPPPKRRPTALKGKVTTLTKPLPPFFFGASRSWVSPSVVSLRTMTSDSFNTLLSTMRCCESRATISTSMRTRATVNLLSICNPFFI